MVGKLIVIEGVDGIGKSTQLQLLRQYFEGLEKKVQSLHFPTHGEGFYGNLVDDYLQGKFGNLSQVPYKFSAFLYSGNRDEKASLIQSWLDDDNVVLLDRYVSSALAHQGSNIESFEERKEFYRWLDTLEFDLNKIPRPDLVLVLDADYSVVEKSVEHRGREDIHEKDNSHLMRAMNVYRELSGLYNNWHLLKCDSNGSLRPREAIHEDIKGIISRL
ncbi:deoxynucleoside kinase [Candidatus Woesearchaeota archaeon]|nr:deoxynucleoside kinase [Candidatus Woesearchaeota archaeon]